MRQGLLCRRIQMGSRWDGYIHLDKAMVTGDGFVRVGESGVLQCRSNAINEAAYAYYTFTLSYGAYAEIIFEAKRVFGLQDISRAGGIAYNQYASPTDYIGGSALEVMPIDSTEWKTYRFAIPSDVNKPFVALWIGAFYNSIGEFHFRKLEVNIYNTTLPAPDIRCCRIVGGGNNWRIENDQNGQVCYGVHRLDMGSNYLRVVYDSGSSWRNPIVQANLGISGGRYGWTVQHGSITRTYCDLYIVNRSGSVVAPTSVTGTNSIQFTAFFI